MPTDAARSPRARTSRFAVAVLIALACTVPAALVHDQAVNVPVLVMSEDEDPTTVKRSSDIFKRVIAELRSSMQRHGFRMIDEESVAVDLGWTIADRRTAATSHAFSRTFYHIRIRDKLFFNNLKQFKRIVL